MRLKANVSLYFLQKCYLYKTCISPNTCLHTTFQNSKLRSASSVLQHGHERLPYTPPAGNHSVVFGVQWHNVYTSFTENSVNWLKSYNGGAETDNVILGDNHFRSTQRLQIRPIWFCISCASLRSITINQSIGKTGHHYVKKRLILCFSSDLKEQWGGKVVNTINNAQRRVSFSLSR